MSASVRLEAANTCADAVCARAGDQIVKIEMARARKELDWAKQFKLAIDPEKAMELRRSKPPTIDPSVCAMCGKWCAIKMVEAYLKKTR